MTADTGLAAVFVSSGSRTPSILHSAKQSSGPPLGTQASAVTVVAVVPALCHEEVCTIPGTLDVWTRACWSSHCQSNTESSAMTKETAFDVPGEVVLPVPVHPSLAYRDSGGCATVAGQAAVTVDPGGKECGPYAGVAAPTVTGVPVTVSSTGCNASCMALNTFRRPPVTHKPLSTGTVSTPSRMACRMR